MAIDSVIPMLQAQEGQQPGRMNPMMLAALNRLGIPSGEHSPVPMPLPYMGGGGEQRQLPYAANNMTTPDQTPLHGGNPLAFGGAGEGLLATPPPTPGVNPIGQYLPPRRPPGMFPGATSPGPSRGIPGNEVVDPLVLAAQRRINYGY